MRFISRFAPILPSEDTKKQRGPPTACKIRAFRNIPRGLNNRGGYFQNEVQSQAGNPRLFLLYGQQHDGNGADRHNEPLSAAHFFFEYDK